MMAKFKATTKSLLNNLYQVANHFENYAKRRATAQMKKFHMKALTVKHLSVVNNNNQLESNF
jgi:hypothetical protein